MSVSKAINVTQIDFAGNGSRVDVALARHRNEAFPMHTHDCFATAIILDGSHVYQQGRRRHHTGAGHVIFTNPQEPHGNEAGGPEGWTCLTFQFDAHLLETLGLTASGADFAFGHAISESPVVSTRMLALGRAALEQRGRLEQDCRLHDLLAGLLRHHRPEDVAQPLPQGRDNRHIRRCLDYIQDNLGTNIGLADLARECGLNPDYLCRLFQRHLGMPPYEYLLNARVNRAEAALKDGRRPVDAALDSGFADQSHMTRMFRRYRRISPAAFQKEVRIVQE